MTTSENCAELYAALAEAQAEGLQLNVDSTNQYAKYNYVKAETIIGEARAVLSRHGLATIHSMGEATVDGHVWYVPIHWRMTHKSGQWIGGTAVFPCAEGKQRPPEKTACSAFTSGRAYLLLGLLQIDRVEPEPGDDISGADDRGYQPGGRQANNGPARREVSKSSGGNGDAVIGHIRAEAAEWAMQSGCDWPGTDAEGDKVIALLKSQSGARDRVAFLKWIRKQAEDGVDLASVIEAAETGGGKTKTRARAPQPDPVYMDDFPDRMPEDNG